MKRILIVVLSLMPLVANSADLYFKASGGPAIMIIDKATLGIEHLKISKNDYGISLKAGVGVRVNDFSLEVGGMNNDVDLDWLLADETYTTSGSYFSGHYNIPVNVKTDINLHIGSFNWEGRIDPGWDHGEIDFNGRDPFWGVEIRYKRDKNGPISIEYENYMLKGIDIHKIGLNYYFGV